MNTIFVFVGLEIVHPIAHVLGTIYTNRLVVDVSVISVEHNRNGVQNWSWSSESCWRTPAPNSNSTLAKHSAPNTAGVQHSNIPLKEYDHGWVQCSNVILLCGLFATKHRKANRIEWQCTIVYTVAVSSISADNVGWSMALNGWLEFLLHTITTIDAIRHDCGLVLQQCIRQFDCRHNHRNRFIWSTK